MRVKKFEAKSMKEALQMVKKELGPDAVILGARDNNRGFGIGGQASVEITAAVTESTLQKKKFVESRLTKSDRERFDQSDARTQRTIIDKMVERRLKSNEAVEAAKERRPITSVSYIDIPDEMIEPGPRRAAAYDRAAGRNVAELLSDFNQDFRQDFRQDVQDDDRDDSRRDSRSSREEQVGRDSRDRRDSRGSRDSRDERDSRNLRDTRDERASRESNESSAQRQATTNGEPQSSERALSRIRNSVREAVRNNPFFEEDSGASNQPRGSMPAKSQARSNEQGRGASSRGGLDIVRSAHDEMRTRNSTGDRQTSQQTTHYMSVERHPSTHETGSVETEIAEIANLKGEISRLQLMIDGFQKVPQTFLGMHPGADFGIPYDLSFMFQKLVDAGVTIDNTVDILQVAAKEIDQVAIKKAPIVDAWVARWILNNTTVVKNPWQGRLHLFLGAAGSGKTSSLVKMASHLVVKEKKRVAILTTDSFKVGAVDQLKIYCQILNVPFAVLRNKKDWEWVLGQLHNVDHILVDFPGLQLRELDEIHLLKSLLPPMTGNQDAAMAPVAHLCVAATTKDGDAYEIARRYKAADPSDIILTNLDQSVQHGIIHNLQKKMGKPLHSFGIGNRIPEDFEVASKERVLDLIFRLTKFRRESK